MSATEQSGKTTQSRVALSLAVFVADVSDLLERFVAFAHSAVHPTDLDEPTRQMLAAQAALTAARTALQKATFAHRQPSQAQREQQS